MTTTDARISAAFEAAHVEMLTVFVRARTLHSNAHRFLAYLRAARVWHIAGLGALPPATVLPPDWEPGLLADFALMRAAARRSAVLMAAHAPRLASVRRRRRRPQAAPERSRAKRVRLADSSSDEECGAAL